MPYAPPPPPAAQPPRLWGDPDHVRRLLGKRVSKVHAETRKLRVDHFTMPAGFREYFKASYGPTIAVYRGLDAAEATRLDAALDDLAQRFDVGFGSTVLEWEYLLLTARRTG